MKVHTTNYSNTFILIADDCTATVGIIPPLKRDEYTVAGLHFEMIANHPYEFNSDDVIFAVFAQRKKLAESDWIAARKEFFSKGQPCFRASPLTKKYGWGMHHNLEGKVALFSRDSTDYMHFEEDSNVVKVKAMKSKK
jgi:hypothetical protein